MSNSNSQDKMRPASQFTGYFDKGFHPPFYKVDLGSAAAVKGELIGSLELYSEVKAFGKELLKVYGHPNLAEAFLQFQAYIRQARTFFEAAEVLHHRASPLNYYYAFLNFAKAYILLRTPRFVDDNLVHGLRHKAKSSSLRKQSVRVLQDGVFPLFYKEVTSASISNGARFKIVDLLGYVSDVGYEYRHLKYGEPQYYRCRFAICNSSTTRAQFAIIAAHRPPSIDISKKNLGLNKFFDAVTLDKHIARELFGLKAEDMPAYQFYESKQQYPPADFAKVPSDIAAKLSGIISYNPFNDPFLFVLNNRIRSPRLAPMHEMLAIYCCMYYLGSLVRYRPDLLEAMLSTKDAWIIERFTKSAPLAFLRHIRNLIDGQYLAYHPR
jgi:YaaC-like Protein